MPDINSTGFDVDEDETLAEDSDPIGGDGGGVMPIWTQSRRDVMDSVVGSNFSNNSSFSIPAGIVGDGTFDVGWRASERLMGVNAQALILDVDGTPLSGTSSIEGEETYSEDTTGRFVLVAPPPSGVISGDGSSGSQFDFRFTPTLAGIDVFVQNIGASYSGGTIRYGSIEGQVTDANGDPVSGESVSAPGAGTNTDTDGNYSFLAPGGTSVTLTSLRGAVDKTQTPSGGSTITVDWQFAGLNVDVFIPDGSGIPGVRVTTELAEGDQQTGASGIASFAEVAPNSTVTVGLFGSEEEREQSIGNEGTFSDLTEETGFGFKGNVVDSGNGEGILGVDAAVDDGRVLTATTPEAGEYVIGGYNTGVVTLTLGREDRRYARFDSEFTVADGDVTRENVELQRQQNIGNSV